jgi:hypothetical protein
MNHLVRVGLLLSLVVGMMGCASSNKSDVAYERYNKVYKASSAGSRSKLAGQDEVPSFKKLNGLVAPGHLYSLYHPSDDKLRGKFRTRFDGMLFLPYNVKINAKGMSFRKLKDAVIGRYAKFFQRGVKDVRFRLIRRDYWVEVRGLVKKSGRYLVKQKDSIDKVIDQAKGLKGDLSKDFFVAAIQQQDKKYTISLNQYFQSNFFGKSPTWTGGDSIFVTRMSEGGNNSELPFVTVLGGVLRPGKTLYQDNASLFYYLSKTGGTISNLDYEESYIIRRGPNGLVKLHFNITDMKSIPAIYPSDIVFLNAEKKTFWDRFWQRTLQVASLISTIAVLIIAL